jgi:diacylglycerol kinase family enzyme
MVSADCGTNWTTVYDKAGAELATGGTTTSEFNNPSQFYRQEVVDLSAYAGNEHVIIKFVFTSAYGNNVFIDNVNITDGPLAIETVDDSSLAIFPNPVKDVLTINYDNAISQIDVYDINGKLVKTFTTVNGTINLSDLSNGVYMLNIQTEEGLVIRKIVKE